MKQLKVLLLAPISVAAGGIHNWTKILLQDKQDDSVEYLVVDTSVRYRTLGGKWKVSGVLCAVRDCILRFFEMIRRFIQDRPGIVYFTCAPSMGFAFRDTPLIILSKLCGRKVIIHLRGGNIPGFWGGNVLKRLMAGRGSRLADYIFVITRECEQFARRRFGPDKVIYIPNFIKTNCLDTLDKQVPTEIRLNRFNVLHVAFQCEVKGTFQAIEAAKDVEGINLLLVGPVAEENRREIEEAIRRHGVEDRVTLVGPKQKPELWHYYRGADLFLFPTHKKGPEGFPNVIMEAMLCRLPIVATDVGNIVEMVDATGEKPAALILKQSDPPQPKEIAERINQLKENRSLRESLAKNGYARVTEKYSTTVVVPALETILHAIKDGGDVLQTAGNHFIQQV